MILIKSLLQYDPTKRPTAKESLEFEYFKPKMPKRKLVSEIISPRTQDLKKSKTRHSSNQLDFNLVLFFSFSFYSFHF